MVKMGLFVAARFLGNEMSRRGTVPPLNRLRIIFAFAAAIVLFVFGVVAAVQIRHNPNSPNDSNVVIAAVISFIGMVIYIAEAVARNRKSRLV
ncbi:unnamed protein product [Didymodactylos carnosus]|uniref:Uncharacterized protein n=1 Tax=Didymodactylos carnosus TaxID=1234261 RepID=A0A813Y486_9BILA|nr:unnamed protein product [Didymodactylos carnosus]CAF1138970.1 unnamed protein product [Didymodactylos carnosus]CAF3663816.1 unnamed protein product [Didymodactylos carnosus]CAF3931450.1 unnamed protein product [Didymodactylos carnosus]